jgi:hypothetical protein
MSFFKWFFSGFLKIVLFFAINALMMLLHPAMPFFVWPLVVIFLFYLGRKTN